LSAGSATSSTVGAKSQNNRYWENAGAEKTRGSVYTPPRIAAALVRWAVRSASNHVLDPACGDGVFLAAGRTRLADLGSRNPYCNGVDIDPTAAAASGGVCDDFFRWVRSAPQYDAVVGNPPFVRSHLFPEESRKLAFQQMVGLGLRPSRLMSTWLPFIALSSGILSETGRLAFVAPEELLQVNYAEELRRFLLSRFRRVIVCVPNADLFPSVQQSVVLLLCDNDWVGPGGLLSMRFQHLEEGPPYYVERAEPWDWSRKWTHLFLDRRQRKLVDDCFAGLPWKRMEDYGRVEVGVVTGDNKFFIVDERIARSIGEQYVTPIVSGARDLRGIRFAPDEFRSLVQEGKPAFLINTSEREDCLPRALQEYLAEGRRVGIHTRYKCRNRQPWYAVPSVRPADAVLLRQAGQVPRLVQVDGRLTSTDTVHRVTWEQPRMGKRHAVGFLNTLTLLACELTGRSYGGGVLELMPREASRLPMPPPSDKLEQAFDKADDLVRRRAFDDVIQLVDCIVAPPCTARPLVTDARDVLWKLIERRKTK